MRYGKRIALFWWNTLVGDAPELFLAALALTVIAFTAGFRWRGASVAFPSVIAIILALSVGLRRHAKR